MNDKMKSGWTTMIAGATRGKADHSENEDSILKDGEGNAHFAWIAIADGVGKSTHSRVAANACTQAVREYFGQTEVGKIDLVHLFAEVQAQLQELGESQMEEPWELDTTLIVGVEFQDRFRFGYVGNGAIWHIRGDYLANLEATVPMPWNWVNYLMPHSIQRQGRERLVRYMSNSVDSNLAIPTVVEVLKDGLWGDMIVMVSDGIDSQDHRQFATAEGELLCYLSPQLLLLHEKLKSVDFLSEEVSGEVYWEGMVRNYLTTLAEHKLLTDDATIGLFVTQQFLKFKGGRCEN